MLAYLNYLIFRMMTGLIFMIQEILSTREGGIRTRWMEIGRKRIE